MMLGILFSIEVLFSIVILTVFIYLATKAKKKKYKFEGILDVGTIKKKKTKRSTEGKHEKRCREIFEETFGKKFKKIRPDWLMNPVTNRRLELDGFCSSIRTRMGKGLAFEYDGVQHSRYVDRFHPNGPSEFIYQLKKDSYKDIKCKENGILLVRIPHFVAYFDLERYIIDILRKEGLVK